jgi:hypothetical protein
MAVVKGTHIVAGHQRSGCLSSELVVSLPSASGARTPEVAGSSKPAPVLTGAARPWGAYRDCTPGSHHRDPLQCVQQAVRGSQHRAVELHEYLRSSGVLRTVRGWSGRGRHPCVTVEWEARMVRCDSVRIPGTDGRVGTQSIGVANTSLPVPSAPQRVCRPKDFICRHRTRCAVFWSLTLSPSKARACRLPGSVGKGARPNCPIFVLEHSRPR